MSSIDRDYPTEALKANRLIGLAMHVRSAASGDGDYATLLFRYTANRGFADEVGRAAHALGLKVTGTVLDNGDGRGKLLLAPLDRNSAFYTNSSRVLDSSKAKGLTRGQFCVALLAVCATMFPQARDLLSPETEPRVSAEMVANNLSDLCNALKAANPEDPAQGSPSLNEAWRNLRALPFKREDETRPNASSLVGIVRLALKLLEENDMLYTSEIDGDTYYIPSIRFRQQLKHLSEHELFSASIELRNHTWNPASAVDDENEETETEHA